MNDAVEGDSVVYRAAAGSVLNGVALQVVAFEVDHIDEARSGSRSTPSRVVASSAVTDTAPKAVKRP